MDWGSELWDQYDTIEKHTQSGLDLVEKYVKFVKERTEIEQNYAKQLRNMTKKYLPKRGSKEEQECRFTNHQAFQDILNEMNDYAGQREVIAENMMIKICLELTKHLQELKQERKTHLSEAKKAQQSLECSFKQMENVSKRFEREWREAERAAQNAEKTDQDINATKADVEKAKQVAHMRAHTAEECKNEYASQLQKYNKEQNQFYYSQIPQIFNKLQDLDERRIRCLAEGYSMFAETEKQVMPIIGKCLEGITKAATNTDQKSDSLAVIEQHKSGFDRPGDVEFEDYSQGINRTSSDSSLSTPKGPLDLLGKNKNKLRLFGKKNKPAITEDFAHLPPEQRRKKLQQKMDEIGKELQKEQDQSEALVKMKDVYEKNPQMGNPESLAPQITQTAQNMERLRGELAKYEVRLTPVVRFSASTSSRTQCVGFNGSLFASAVVAGGGWRTDNANCEAGDPDSSQAIYAEFDEFDEDEMDVPIGQCTALYSFPGSSEGTISMQEGEVLSVVEEDKGDGWTRVRRPNGDEGYIPTSYVKITLPK
uniref:Thyroid hormone receptor interactor 10b n=1 Tax=Scleropages formosus TaxID=113540 RepID=A0A8C9U7C5_SCLFO